MNRQRKAGTGHSGAGLLTISCTDSPTWKRETAKNASFIVTISQYSLEKIKQFYNVDEAKIRIVPNGVDPEKFKPIADQDGG